MNKPINKNIFVPDSILPIIFRMHNKTLTNTVIPYTQLVFSHILHSKQKVRNTLNRLLSHRVVKFII